MGRQVSFDRMSISWFVSTYQQKDEGQHQHTDS